jgi:clan AA aspartic protease
MSTFQVSVQVAASAGGPYQTLEALVDTGATYTVMPRDVLDDLGVVVEGNRFFEIADGSEIELQVGEASIRVGERRVTVLVVFGPEGIAPLLGATTLEMASLAVDPIRETLVPVSGLLKNWLEGTSSNGVS